MTDESIRRAIHNAVDASAAHVLETPALAARILALNKAEEVPIMKRKLSFGAIIVIALLLFTVTAVAVGLSAYDIWQESFDRMNTEGEVRMLTDPTGDDMPVEEAIAIARRAIQQKYGATDAELDAMGVYPTFIGRDWEWGDSTEPDEWDIMFSSVTDGNIDADYRNIGSEGEYLVYIDAENKEVTYCHWYTVDFWARAQRIWDCGSYDEVYTEYKRAGFFNQPLAQQAHFEALLAEKGYTLRTAEEKYPQVLKANASELLHCEPGEYALDAAAPQAIAAWRVIEEQFGLPQDRLAYHAFEAHRLGAQTGTDDIIICYNYESTTAPHALQAEMTAPYWSLYQFSESTTRLGLFMVSFEPGTTTVHGVTHLLWSDNYYVTPVAEGKLLEKTDWNAADFTEFDAAFIEYAAAIGRMEAANAGGYEYTLVQDAVMRSLGGDASLYDGEMAGYDVAKWFSAATAPTPAPAVTPVPSIAPDVIPAEYQALTHADASQTWGDDPRFWPLEAQAALLDEEYSFPRAGEMTREQAIEKAKAAIAEKVGPDALDRMGEYRIGCHLLRKWNSVEFTTWQVYFCDPQAPETGWWVSFVDLGWERFGPGCTVKSTGDLTNG